MTRIYLMIVSLCFLNQVFSQSQIEKDTRTLTYIIDGFLEKSDKYFEGRKAELVLMLLETDSTGKISAIHLLSDKKNIDSTYSKLERMRVEVFGGNMFTSCKNKIINLPIYSITGDTFRNYVEKSIVYLTAPIVSKRGSVLLPPMFYLTPGKPNYEF